MSADKSTQNVKMAAASQQRRIIRKQRRQIYYLHQHSFKEKILTIHDSKAWIYNKVIKSKSAQNKQKKFDGSDLAKMQNFQYRLA